MHKLTKEVYSTYTVWFYKRHIFAMLYDNKLFLRHKVDAETLHYLNPESQYEIVQIEGGMKWKQ